MSLRCVSTPYVASWYGRPSWRAAVGLTALMIALWLAGCGGRSACPACEQPVHQPAIQEACALSETAMATAFQNAFTRVEGKTAMLLLSGGGAHGAWGAGVLYGWRDTPPFQIVTGISTGALIATFAFLGEAYDELLKQFYTGVSSRDIIRRRPVLSLLFADSLYSMAPLKRLLDEQLTEARIDAVARIATEEGRQLWVGTVNLDTGAFCAWNLTQIAQQRAYALYRQIVLASASMPVLTSPVEIDGALHVDGGTRLQVFGRSVLNRMVSAYQGVQRRRAAPPETGQDELTIYVIINGKLIVENTCVRDALFDIGVRSLSVVLHEALLGNLFRLQETFGGQQSSARVRFQATWIPEDYCLDFDSFEFDTAKMQRLFDAGVAWGQQQLWRDDITPQLEVSPRPCQCTAAEYRKNTATLHASLPTSVSPHSWSWEI